MYKQVLLIVGVQPQIVVEKFRGQLSAWIEVELYVEDKLEQARLRQPELIAQRDDLIHVRTELPDLPPAENRTVDAQALRKLLLREPPLNTGLADVAAEILEHQKRLCALCALRSKDEG